MTIDTPCELSALCAVKIVLSFDNINFIRVELNVPWRVLNLHDGFVILRKSEVLDDVPGDMFSFRGAGHPISWDQRERDLFPWLTKFRKCFSRGAARAVAAATITEGRACTLKTWRLYTASGARWTKGH